MQLTILALALGCTTALVPASQAKASVKMAATMTEVATTTLESLATAATESRGLVLQLRLIKGTFLCCLFWCMLAYTLLLHSFESGEACAAPTSRGL